MDAQPTYQPSDRKDSCVSKFVLAFFVCLTLAFLASLLLPVRNPDRGGARRAYALSNVKQSGTALLMYTADNNERYPDANRWMDSIKEYAKREDIFRSPLATPDDPTDYGFAFRQGYSQKRQTDFIDPELRVSLFDSTILTRNAASGLETLPKPGRYEGGGDRGNMIGFVDSHVKFVRDSVLRELAPDGKPRIR